MESLNTQKEMQQFAKRGEAIYAKRIEPTLKPTDRGKRVVIHVCSGDFLIGRDEIKLINRLRKKHSDGLFYFMRVGYDTSAGYPE